MDIDEIEALFVPDMTVRQIILAGMYLDDDDRFEELYFASRRGEMERRGYDLATWADDGGRQV